MAFIQCDFFSDCLGLSVSMNVILPQNTTGQIGLKGRALSRRHPVLWLLHGLSDDHTIWQRRTSIERYVAPLGLAVVMPAVNRSFYSDEACGPRYWTFISEELPAVARSFFPLSDKRSDNFVAGLSMGGYGAFKLALARPDLFSYAASLSGALDISEYMENLIKGKDEWRKRECKGLFGAPPLVKGSANDLFALARKLADTDQPVPKLFQMCGTDDYLLPANRRFRQHLLELELPVRYEERPGQHEWGFWDSHIQDVLKWLPLKSQA